MGINPSELKRDFGAELTFWGGGVDTQHMLPQGTKREIRDEIRQRVEELAPGGGFVFAAVHNIQADVSPENVVAMLEAFDAFSAY